MTSTVAIVAKMEGFARCRIPGAPDGKPGRRYAHVGVPVFSADRKPASPMWPGSKNKRRGA